MYMTSSASCFAKIDRKVLCAVFFLNIFGKKLSNKIEECVNNLLEFGGSEKEIYRVGKIENRR